MYSIKTVFEISAAHKLYLNYDSPCSELHGHNWKITVYCRSNKLNSNGMVIDFAKLKKFIKERYDHKCLNDVIVDNPTAENIAYDIANCLNDMNVCKRKRSSFVTGSTFKRRKVMLQRGKQNETI